MAGKTPIVIVTGKRGGLAVAQHLFDTFEASDWLTPRIFLCDQAAPYSADENTGIAPIANYRILCGHRCGVASTPIRRAMLLGEIYMNLLFEVEKLLAQCPKVLILVYGDRGEHLMAAAIANQLGRSVKLIQLQAGDVTGSIDNDARWAITKLTDLAIAHTGASLTRLVHRAPTKFAGLTSDPKIDLINEFIHLHHPESLERSSTALIMINPNTLENHDKDLATLICCINTANELHLEAQVILPSADFHSSYLHTALPKLKQAFKILPPLAYREFLFKLCQASIFLTNSSAAFIEAPKLATPTVVVGLRQKGREFDDILQGVWGVDDLTMVSLAAKDALSYTGPYASPYEIPSLVSLGPNKAAEDILYNISVFNHDDKIELEYK